MDAIPTVQIVGDVLALVHLLEQQRALYRRLRLLGDRQRTLVMMDDHQPLLELLAERQQVVDGLVGLVGQMAPYRNRTTQLYRQMDEASRRRVTSLLEEVNSSLGSILQSDRQDTATLQARKECTTEHLSAVTTGRRASAAYATAGSAFGRFTTDAEA